jgi:hypothetical protein
LTRGIEDFFGLPRLEETLRADGIHPFDNESKEESEDEISENKELTEMFNNAEKNIERFEGTDHEEAMDKVFDETLQHARDLMDLGFNVDIPRARGIFEVATAMYGQAISAKNSKRDAQLKKFKLMLDQRKLEMDEKKLKTAGAIPATEESTQSTDSVIVEDRNTLIQMIREGLKKDGK